MMRAQMQPGASQRSIPPSRRKERKALELKAIVNLMQDSFQAFRSYYNLDLLTRTEIFLLLPSNLN